MLIWKCCIEIEKIERRIVVLCLEHEWENIISKIKTRDTYLKQLFRIVVVSNIPERIRSKLSVLGRLSGLEFVNERDM